MYKFNPKTGETIQTGKPAELTRVTAENSRISVIDQAGMHAAQILQDQKTDLQFYPLKQSVRAHSNMFRLGVMNIIAGNPVSFIPYGYTARTWSDSLQVMLQNSGYTIKEIEPE